MRRNITLPGVLLGLCLMLVATVGATLEQVKPPQPFGQDFFLGQASVEGKPPPLGMELFACIDNCGTFKSATVGIRQGGAYSQLVVNPSNRSLVGHPIRFYMANEFGRIEAIETVDFKAAYDFFTVDLTFNDPVPAPTPTPTITPTASLPAPGDPTVTAIPRIALMVGAAAVLLGSALLLALRRHAT